MRWHHASSCERGVHGREQSSVGDIRYDHERRDFQWSAVCRIGNRGHVESKQGVSPPHDGDGRGGAKKVIAIHLPNRLSMQCCEYNYARYKTPF